MPGIEPAAWRRERQILTTRPHGTILQVVQANEHNEKVFSKR